MKKRITLPMQGVKSLLCGVFSALVCSLCCAAVSFASEEAIVVSEGVFIGDEDVSGMTVQELEDYIEGEVDALGESVITIQVGDDFASKTLSELGLTWENQDLVQEISEIGTTGNIVKRYKEQKNLQNQSASFEIEYSLDESILEGFVSSCSIFNSEPVEGSIYMGSDGLLYVEGGTDGLTLDVDATVATVNEYISDWEAGDRMIEAVVDRISPTITAELLSKITDVLGTATTSYAASSAARAQNVENGTAKISGTLLMPGESFSVTAAVAPFTAENGYELAPSYEAGQVVDSYGGGICQVSTTLYNAVLKAELQVNERHNHTMLVTYVDPSKDAAIAEGTMDFSFTNTLDYPVYIAGSAYYGTLNFTIYGVETRPSNRTLEFVSETLSQTDPNANIQLVAKTDQNVGYLYQVQSPHQGLSAVLWKKIYIDGVLSDTIQVNSSNYTASAAIYEVGVVTGNAALSSALYTAIAANDLNQVQYLITYGVQTQTETTAQTDPPADPVADPPADPPEDPVTDPAAGAPADTPTDDVTVIE